MPAGAAGWAQATTTTSWDNLRRLLDDTGPTLPTLSTSVALDLDRRFGLAQPINTLYSLFLPLALVEIARHFLPPPTEAVVADYSQSSCWALFQAEDAACQRKQAPIWADKAPRPGPDRSRRPANAQTNARTTRRAACGQNSTSPFPFGRSSADSQRPNPFGSPRLGQ